MPVTAAGPFHGDCRIVTKGTAKQLTTTRTHLRHAIISAYDDNQGDIVIGVGSGVNTTKGNYGKRLRAGDTYEFISEQPLIYIDLSVFYINNDSGVLGFDGDGVSILNPGWE